jgi:hypothetical protein
LVQRDFKSFLDHGPEAKRIGLALEDARKRLFRHWYRARDGTIRRSTLQVNTRPIQREILDLLREGIHCPSKKVAGMCREILGAQHSLFTFIAHDGVEPTNNRSYAARGISRAMPRPGLCRVEVARSAHARVSAWATAFTDAA